MTLSEIVALAALGLGAVNALVLLLTFRRAERWKESEDAKELIRRVSNVEGDVTGLKAKMENVATKADIARLTAEVIGVEASVKRIDGATDRIEQHLMNERNTK